MRTAAATVTVTARLTDGASGVADAPRVCLDYPSAGRYWQAGACPTMRRVSGTALDGWWRATVPVPRGAVSGLWNVRMTVTDAAHAADTPGWLGPDEFALRGGTSDPPDPSLRALPAGLGRVEVRGDDDPLAPEVRTVTLTPARVDTLAAEARVGVEVAALDPDGYGITAVSVQLHATSEQLGAPWLPGVEVTAPVRGTRADGVWHLDVALPRGTPPGSYALHVWVQDAGHWRSYVAPSSPHATPDEVLTPEQTPGGDGTVTVVAR